MTTRKSAKPKKPRPDFPLFPHSNGQWAKKIRGKLHYFGLWADPEGAFNRYLDERDDLHAGRTPRHSADEVQVRDVLNHFLTAKQRKRDAGELAPRTWAEYYACCERIGQSFGVSRIVADLGPDDFAAYRAAIAVKWGPVRVGNEVQRVRTVFKHAHDSDLIAFPVRFGPDFKKPDRKTLRKARAERGVRMFESAQLRKLLKAARGPLPAMILLGVNCGYGNADVGALEWRHLDLKGRWANFPRPKTGIERRCPLWPETVAALRAWQKVRPDPKDSAHANRVFITKHGHAWDKGATTGKHGGPLSLEMKKLLDELKLYRGGLGFYTLRHTFATVAGDSRDQVAVNAVMGHADESMASAYRERIDDARLTAVTDHVRKWLIGAKVMR